MARIMLIEPPIEREEGVMRILASIGSNKANWKFPPLDLLGIGGILRKNRLEDFLILDALNLELKFSETKEIIKKEKPEIVIFTFTVPTIKNDMKTAEIAKGISRNIKTVAVNFAAESYPGNILEDFPELDFLAYHEPEIPILELIENSYEPQNVSGIYWRENTKVRKNKEKFLQNLDNIGIMTHDKIPLKIYRSPYQKRKPMSATSFTRGCINQCAHCLVKFLNPLRVRSIDSCIEELKFLQSLGVKELRFFDGELTCNMEWADELFERWIREKIDITFSCNVRADRVSENLLKKMKKAGCHLLSIGLDSTDQKILDNIKKNLTVKQIIDAIMLIKKMGFHFTIFTTFGHKGETKETMFDTIEMVKKLRPDMCAFTIAVPVLGTEFYNYLKKNRFLDENISLELYDPNLPPVYNYPEISKEEMYKISMFGYRTFYFNPFYIIRKFFRSYNRLDDIKSMFYCIRRYLIEPIHNKK